MQLVIHFEIVITIISFYIISFLHWVNFCLVYIGFRNVSPWSVLTQNCDSKYGLWKENVMNCASCGMHMWSVTGVPRPNPGLFSLSSWERIRIMQQQLHVLRVYPRSLLKPWLTTVTSISFFTKNSQEMEDIDFMVGYYVVSVPTHWCYWHCNSWLLLAMYHRPAVSFLQELMAPNQETNPGGGTKPTSSVKLFSPF